MKYVSRILLWTLGTFVAAFMVAPVLIVIPLSFTGAPSFRFPPASWSTHWYENFLSDSRWVGSLGTSLLVGLLSAAVATAVGTLAALGIQRLRPGLSRAMTTGLLITPMLVPGVVLAVGLFSVLAFFGALGSIAGFVFAHSILGLPFVVISVSAGLATVDRNLSQAAESLGATPWRTFKQVVFPLIVPGVAAGALLAFVTSFDEVLVALFIQSPFLQTLPVRMYTSVVDIADPTMAASASIVLTITTTVLVISQWASLNRRRFKKERNS